MPTGYTAEVYEGKAGWDDFRRFAMRCAHAFGALITLRDSSWEDAVPDEILPDEYHRKSLEDARAHLIKLEAMTSAEVAEAAEREYIERMKSWKESVEREKAEQERYKTMLAQVKAWTPPTAEHSGLKDFMIEQLKISMGTEPIDWERYRPTKRTPEEWQEQEIGSAHKRVGRDAAEWEKEQQRARGRTEWIRALKASLDDVPARR